VQVVPPPPLALQRPEGINPRLKILPGIIGLKVYFTSTRFKTKEGASGSAAAAEPVKLALPKLVQVVTPLASIPTV
jgi:hypothetical protein